MSSPFTSRRTELCRAPSGLFVHMMILEACQRFGEKEAIIDYSCDCPRRISYSEYGELVERIAGSFATRFRPGEVVAIFLYNSWEFCASYHAATLAGCIPTLLNPSYREREVRYQLENSEAVALVTDGPQIRGLDLGRLPRLREVFATRASSPGTTNFCDLLRNDFKIVPALDGDTREVLAVLPYSSGTTGLPKGVMLSHSNLVTNMFQTLAPGEEATYTPDDITLCCLPLYHIYGLNVVLNPILAVGGTLMLMPRFDEAKFFHVLGEERPTFLPLVPPLINCFCQAAEEGRFPIRHSVRYVKSGAAPLAPDLASRLTNLTGIRVRQGYGMTEASPVTHLGYLEPDLYMPDSIGQAVAQTECLLANGHESCQGELVMRGPQFMLGYWKAPEATASALREGWYWSGDVATVDPNGFYRIVDRVKEMIKYKGFAIAPAEVEAVLLEHPLVRDCGIVGQRDATAGEIPCAFVVLRDGQRGNMKIADELSGYVGERLTHYKQPREIRFVNSIPRNPSGKILRRMLREQL